ncbi:putative EMP1-like protein, partial [Plasmodium gaboni]
IFVPRTPKHKTLIQVVLEPTNRNSGDTTNSINTPKDDISTNKLTEEQWNQLKQEFISNILQNDEMDISRSNISGTPPTNTQPDPTYVSQNIYSGIHLINDSLSGNNIYDEVLKRKENELFGTNHPKHNTTNSDPILNQLDLVDQWLDKNRYICETFSNKEELLDKLKELWDNKNKNSGITDISQNNMFNSNISLQTYMDPKPKNQFAHMDTILDDKSVDHNKIHIEMNANNKTNGSFEKQYPIYYIWNI